MHAQPVPAPAANPNIYAGDCVDCGRRVPRFQGTCHRAPDRRRGFVVRCAEHGERLGGGGGAPRPAAAAPAVAPPCTADVARAVASLYRTSLDKTPALAAVLGPAAALCAWRSEDATAIAMLADTPAGREVARAGIDPDVALEADRIVDDNGGDAPPPEGIGADIVADILGRRPAAAPRRELAPVVEPAALPAAPAEPPVDAREVETIDSDNRRKFTVDGLMYAIRYADDLTTVRHAEHAMNPRGGHWVLIADYGPKGWTPADGGFSRYADAPVLAALREREPDPVKGAAPVAPGETTRHTVVRGVGHVTVTIDRLGASATASLGRTMLATWKKGEGWRIDAGSLGGTEFTRVEAALLAILPNPERAPKRAKPAGNGGRWDKFRK